MVNNFNWINIREVISRVLRNPLLQSVDLEAAIQYTIDFIAAMGLPTTFIDKYDTVEIENYRGMLPCDLISIEQVRNEKTKVPMRWMTDNFNEHSDHINSFESFKVQGRIIYTSFKEGKIGISYKAVKVDKEGIPMLPDNPIFLKALELYITKEEFTRMFYLDKLGANGAAKLQHVEQEYAFKAGQCNNEFIIPSVSEMQSLTGMLHQLVPHQDEFRYGFKTLGDKEQYKIH